MTDNFDERNREMIARMNADSTLQRLTREWQDRGAPLEYSYHFRWLGVPIIQYPQDIVALQEIIWQVRPDVIIETGIARGGSLIFYASMLQLLGGDGVVVGVDIDIRPHNRVVIEAHPLFPRIRLIEGSSVDRDVVARAAAFTQGRQRVMVVLDSNHTHDHVRQELALYSPLVTPGSYLVVLDTVIEQMPADAFPDRPWGRGDNPWTAVQEFLKGQHDFEVDAGIHQKLLITVAPDGYLKRIR
jgi:cephalosporin hydroxylase